MPRPKNFMVREARPDSAGEGDFALLLEAHLAARPVISQDLPIDRIRPNPYQARRNFDGLDELASAIRAQGFTSRLRVRRDPSTPGIFQLVFGERRLRAAEQAGLKEVPCDIAEHSDSELVEIGLAENIQRRDLNPLEEARAFQAVMQQHGYSNRRLAERIGKDKSYVEERLVLLRTPEDVQQMVAQRPDTIRVAREIAKLATPERRRPLIQLVLAGEISARDIRTMVRAETSERSKDGALGPPPLPTTIPRPPGRPARGESPVNLIYSFDRDRQLLRVMLARWRQALPRLDREQRERVLMYIEEHVGELERVTEALRAPTGQE